MCNVSQEKKKYRKLKIWIFMERFGTSPMAMTKTPSEICRQCGGRAFCTPNEIILIINRRRRICSLIKQLKKDVLGVEKRLKECMSWSRGMNNRAEMLKTHSTAQLTSHLQLFRQENSVPRSKVAIVTTKDILSERPLKKNPPNCRISPKP